MPAIALCQVASWNENLGQRQKLGTNCENIDLLNSHN